MENEMMYTSFLGTGWSFPPTFNKAQKGVEMLTDEADIKSSLEILLSTELGERFLQPKYGCNLQDMVFEAMGTTMKTYMENLIKQAIKIYEARIRLIGVTLDLTFELEGRIDIIIEYDIRTTNSRFNMVYPFYVNEGNVIQK